jgi:hypothetical protein
VTVIELFQRHSLLQKPCLFQSIFQRVNGGRLDDHNVRAKPHHFSTGLGLVIGCDYKDRDRNQARFTPQVSKDLQSIHPGILMSRQIKFGVKLPAKSFMAAPEPYATRVLNPRTFNT